MTNISISQKQKKLDKITYITNHSEGEESEIRANENFILHRQSI